jgi:hypothetical protein
MKISKTLFILALALSPTVALAVDWTGGGDGMTWTDAGNWSGPTPLGTDNVIINDGSINGGTIDFDSATFGNLTIGGPTVGTNNMGAGLTLSFDAAGAHFGAAGGEIRVKAGTGAVSIVNTNNQTFNLNDGNIVVEEGVTGDFFLGSITPGNPRMSFGDPLNNNTVTSTFTNNSVQDFILELRHNADDLELTFHSDVNGTAGNFIFPGHSIRVQEFDVFNVTGDARVDINSSLGSDGGSNVGAPRLSSELNTEITSTGAMRTLTTNVNADTNVAGKITGNLHLNLGLGSENSTTFSNDDTYVGTTKLGGGNTNTNRAMALIREGTHVGGDSYSIIGGLRGGRDNDAILGGSGTIELQSDATLTLNRPNSDSDSAAHRATLAPGNTGFSASEVNTGTGMTQMLTSATGRGIGTLTVTADEVVFGDYSRFEASLSGPASDSLVILAGTGTNTNAGDLNLSSLFNELFIDADLLGDANGDTYDLITWEGTRTGEFETVWLQDGGALTDITADLGGFQIDGFDYSLEYGANVLQLIGPNSANSQIPEPASIALWSILGMILFGRQLRKRR